MVAMVDTENVYIKDLTVPSGGKFFLPANSLHGDFNQFRKFSGQTGTCCEVYEVPDGVASTYVTSPPFPPFQPSLALFAPIESPRGFPVEASK